MEYNQLKMEDNQQTMEDNEQTLEDNEQTMEENQQIMEVNQQIMENDQQTMADNQEIVKDNQKIMEDQQQSIEDNQLTMEDNQQKMDNPQTMEDDEQTMEDNQQIIEDDQLTMEDINQKMEDNQQILKGNLKTKVYNEQFTNSVHPCDECGKIFSEKEKLGNHKSYTHRIEVSVCSICGNEFQNKQKLQKHINARHKDKGLHCDMCIKVFKNNSDLYGHKKKVHEEIENLACEKCGVKMMNNFKLKRHMRKTCPGYKHTQEHLYCVECNRIFKSMRAFNGHNKLAHSNDPIHFYDPVKCSICQKDSKNISYFRQHLKRSHKLIDPNHILSLIKDVKPEFVEELIRKKEVNYISDFQKQKSDQINKWKEIEKENNERINAEKMIPESDENKHSIKKVAKDIKMEELELKSEAGDDFEINDELELKSEAGDDFEINDELPIKKQRHACAHCGKLFSRGNKLKNHIKLKHTDEPCTCPFCGCKTLKNKSDLSMHIKKAHADFKLPKEEKTTIYDEEKIQLNEVLVDETKQKIKSESEAITIETTESQIFEPCSCPFCEGTLLKNKTYLDRHLEQFHKGYKLFEPCSCPFCEGTLLKNKTYLKKHLEQFHKGCELPEKNINKINEEQEIKMNQDSLDDFFETSNYEAKNEEDIEIKPEMIETVIEDLEVENPFTCDLCSQTFTTKWTFEQHKLIHTGEKHSEQSDNEVECICEQCGKSCKSKRALYDHTRAVHLGKYQTGPTGIFKCSECDKEFGRRHALYNHKYYTHMIQNVVCPSCGKTCKNKMSLTRHMKRTCSSV